jgi:hypothetical protein
MKIRCGDSFQKKNKSEQIGGEEVFEGDDVFKSGERVE